ncbi:MAG: hypothetical protein J6K96_09875 [Treponema sp.]|nr:hypothetical protein [Treponema sp.]
MEKTILIAGKNMPDAGTFTDGISVSGRNIIVTGPQNRTDEPPKKLTIAERKSNQAAYEEEKNQEAKSGLCTIEWNKSSPLSARSLVLQTITIFGRMDEAVLFFDEEWFASRAEKMDSEEISRGCDEMIAGYQYLAVEIISTFQKKDASEAPGTLVFLLKETPSRADVLHDSTLNNGLRSIASPLVSAGAAAFVSFAENLAAVCADSAFVNVVLVRDSSAAEGYRRDDETGRWLCTYLNSLEDGTQKPGKKTVQWIRPGVKQPSSGGFKFFKRQARS